MTNCPSCGAPVDESNYCKCPYCDTIINANNQGVRSCPSPLLKNKCLLLIAEKKVLLAVKKYKKEANVSLSEAKNYIDQLVKEFNKTGDSSPFKEYGNEFNKYTTVYGNLYALCLLLPVVGWIPYFIYLFYRFPRHREMLLKKYGLDVYA